MLPLLVSQLPNHCTTAATTPEHHCHPTFSVRSGVTCSPIRVEVPQLDEDHAAAAAASAGITGSTAAGAAAPSSWHQLWGAGAYQDVMPNAAAGSFLLGKLGYDGVCEGLGRLVLWGVSSLGSDVGWKIGPATQTVF